MATSQDEMLKVLLPMWDREDAEETERLQKARQTLAQAQRHIRMADDGIRYFESVAKNGPNRADNFDADAELGAAHENLLEAIAALQAAADAIAS